MYRGNAWDGDTARLQIVPAEGSYPHGDFRAEDGIRGVLTDNLPAHATHSIQYIDTRIGERQDFRSGIIAHLRIALSSHRRSRLV